ncbi:MAG TPA: YciI family protein [Blastocatellia bacterium]|nr:YciI family protein [Blastocatellia bacterium]
MMKTIVILLRPGAQWNPNKPVREQAYWDEHARFMDSLFEAGTVRLGGPFADGSGSMVILEAESVESAKAIFQNDPWAQQDVLVASEVKEWTIFLDARDKAV